MATTQHHWTVDAVAEGVARVEVDGGAVVNMPHWLLPLDVQEGDVLRVTHDRTRGRSTVAIERDPAASRVARERSAARLARRPIRGAGDAPLPPRDERGDIEL